jgi:hypothetical protein
MARKECPKTNPECKYFDTADGCFSDLDHIYGRARGLGRIARRFANLPENKRQICRAEHDEINATYVHLPLPDLDTMKEILRLAKGNNNEQLSTEHLA